MNFFRVCYELKEALKKEIKIPDYLKGHNGAIEVFCSQDQWIALGLDIANKAKHIVLNNSKSGKEIGKMNTHIHLFSPDGKDRTELTIEINGKKEDCLNIVKNCFDGWEKFLRSHNLL